MIKNILKISLISIGLNLTLNASIIENQISSMSQDLFNKLTNNKSRKEETIDYKKNEEKLDFKPLIERENTNITKSSIFIKRFINDKECDQILDNDGYFTTCYNYYLKSSIKGYSKIDGDLVNKENIEKRPTFYKDKNIPEEYQTLSSDYIKSGFDQGHNIGSNASFDYSLKSQKTTYVMSNIVPQYPNTNRKSYLNVENYERIVATKFGNAETLTFNFFTKKPERLGRSDLAIPVGFAKIIWNEKEKFQRCFYIPNDDKIYDLQNLEVPCQKLIEKL